MPGPCPGVLSQARQRIGQALARLSRFSDGLGWVIREPRHESWSPFRSIVPRAKNTTIIGVKTFLPLSSSRILPPRKISVIGRMVRTRRTEPLPS